MVKKLISNKLQAKKLISFTLLELLVVVAILGLLTILSIRALNPARIKARDTRRVADLQQLSKALELYYLEKGFYPAGQIGSNSQSGFCIEKATGPGSFQELMSSYIKLTNFRDPKYNSSQTYPEYCYWYQTDSVGQKYKLSARMEQTMASAFRDGGIDPNTYEVYAGSNAQTLGGWVLVPKNSNNDYYFDRSGSILNGRTGFYVMQYEAKYDTDGDGRGNDAGQCHYTSGHDTWDWGKTGTGCPSSWSANNVISSAEGSPIAGITHTEALTACPASTHLITNDEWMAIARDAEKVGSNWHGGVVGTNCLYRGNCGITDNCGYNGPNPEKGLGRNTKAKFILSNNSEIWDIAGNVWEHVSFTPSGSDATHQELDQPDQAGSGLMWSEFTSLTNNGANTFISGYSDGKAVFRPSDDSYNSTKGVGQIGHYSNSGSSTARVFFRGGIWNGGIYAGAFTLHLMWAASDHGSEVGFRCAR